MALITCKNAAFSYERTVAVDGLSFEVNQGDYLCIVGENGSGKSTLMKGLLGLMRPQSGSIEMGAGIKQTQIGYLPQQTSTQKNFPANCFEVALSGRLSSRGILPAFVSRHIRTMWKSWRPLPYWSAMTEVTSGFPPWLSLTARGLPALAFTPVTPTKR